MLASSRPLSPADVRSTGIGDPVGILQVVAPVSSTASSTCPAMHGMASSRRPFKPQERPLPAGFRPLIRSVPARHAPATAGLGLSHSCGERASRAPPRHAAQRSVYGRSLCRQAGGYPGESGEFMEAWISCPTPLPLRLARPLEPQNGCYRADKVWAAVNSHHSGSRGRPYRGCLLHLHPASLVADATRLFRPRLSKAA